MDEPTSNQIAEELTSQTNRNPTSSHQLQPRPLPAIDQKLEELLNAIQFWFNDKYHQPMLLLESLSTTKTLQLQWLTYQQFATEEGPPAYGTLRCHYELGHTIKQHKQQSIQQGINGRDAEQQCKLFFKSIINEN